MSFNSISSISKSIGIDWIMQRNNVCTECVIYMEMYNYGFKYGWYTKNIFGKDQEILRFRFLFHFIWLDFYMIVYIIVSRLYCKFVKNIYIFFSLINLTICILDELIFREVKFEIRLSRANLKIYMSKLICGKYTCFENILMQLKYKIYIFPGESFILIYIFFY